MASLLLHQPVAKLHVDILNLVKLQKFLDSGDPSPPYWEKFPKNVVFLTSPLRDIGDRSGAYSRYRNVFSCPSSSMPTLLSK